MNGPTGGASAAGAGARCGTRGAWVRSLLAGALLVALALALLSPSVLQHTLSHAKQGAALFRVLERQRPAPATGLVGAPSATEGEPAAVAAGPAAAGAGKPVAAGSASPYHSLGKVTDFYSDVSAPGGIEAAVRARSFNGELILMTMSTASGGKASELFLRWAVAAVAGLKAHGYEHYLLLASDKVGCDRFKSFYPAGSCGWTTYLHNNTALAGWGMRVGSTFWLWAMRWRVAGDLLAELSKQRGSLGHGLMSSDLDVAFMLDPYPLLKGPLLGKYHLIMRQEPINQLPGKEGSVNCGWAYVQNSGPGRGAHFVLAETAGRIERWLATPPPKADARGRHHVLYEQAIFSDVLRSAFAGRSIFQNDLRPYLDNDAQHQAWNEVGSRGQVAAEDLLWQTTEPVKNPLPPCEGCDATARPRGLASQPLYYHSLRPTIDSEDPWKQPGGPHGPDVGGPERLWSPKGPSVQAASSDELVLAAPIWLQTTWVEAREISYTAARPPQAAMHHNVLVPSALIKRLSHKLWGIWPREANLVGADGAKLLVPYADTTRVLALAPLPAAGGLPSGAVGGATLEATLAAYAEMALMAAALDRVLVVPLLDCAAPWIQKAGAGSGNMYETAGFLPPADYSRVMVGGTRTEPQCYLLPAPECDETAGVIYPCDLEALEKEFPSKGPPAGRIFSTSSLAATGAPVSAAALAAALGSHSNERLLYVNAVVKLARESLTSAAAKRYDAMMAACLFGGGHRIN